MRIKFSELRALITETLDVDAAYALLDLAPGATPLQIRNAWRNKMHHYRYEKAKGDPWARAKIQNLNQVLKMLLGDTPEERATRAELPDAFQTDNVRKAKDSYKVYAGDEGRSVIRIDGELYGTGPDGDIGAGKKTAFKKNDRAKVAFDPDNDGRVTVSDDDNSQVWNPVDEA